MKSGELAAAAGVNIQTLRYYERRGLLPEPDRTLGGHRSYPPDALDRLRLIKGAQHLGFTLTEIESLLTDHPGLRTSAAAKLAEIETRITELAEIAETLRAALSAGCENLTECAHTPSCPLAL